MLYTFRSKIHYSHIHNQFTYAYIIHSIHRKYSNRCVRSLVFSNNDKTKQNNKKRTYFHPICNGEPDIFPIWNYTDIWKCPVFLFLSCMQCKCANKILNFKCMYFYNMQKLWMHDKPARSLIGKKLFFGSLMVHCTSGMRYSSILAAAVCWGGGKIKSNSSDSDVTRTIHSMRM